MASMLKAYNSILQRRPMLAQCTTAAVLFGTGDVIAQQAVEKRGRNHDFYRTARLSFYGGCMFGPVVTKWFQFLNRLQFSSPKKAVVYKVFLDQFVLTPAIIVYFFGSMTFLEGKGVSEAKDRLSKAYTPTLVRNWGVFIPTQIVNFALVPPHLRFLTVSVVSLFWNTYLSAVNAQQKVDVEQEDLKVR